MKTKEPQTTPEVIVEDVKEETPEERSAREKLSIEKKIYHISIATLIILIITLCTVVYKLWYV